MQQCTSLLLDLFPGDRFCLARLDLMQTAHDLLLPGGVDVRVDGGVQAGNQVSGQFRTFVIRQCKGLLQQFSSFLGHGEIIAYNIKTESPLQFLVDECFFIHYVGHLGNVPAVVPFQDVDQALNAAACHSFIRIGR